MSALSLLWRAPEVNPVNHKARSIPIFNVANKYGRVFFFSWFGFFIAFWSWYAFPPLMTVTIPLTGTLVVRLIAGPACDRWGPRWTFIGVLATGAIPTALSGLVRSVSGLIMIRFFVGILGGTFVPCQVWSTTFFDKNVVGSANALIGGWGNAGGGITYFLMPLIYDSLHHNMRLTASQAWRVAFVVPFILITATSLGMLLFCEDTPTGKWSERHDSAIRLPPDHQFDVEFIQPEPLTMNIPNIPVGHINNTDGAQSKAQTLIRSRSGGDVEIVCLPSSSIPSASKEVDMASEVMVASFKHEIVVSPTLKETCHVFFSLQTAFHACAYLATFGGELTINSYLAAYYLRNFPQLGQTKAGQWASMFGLLNIFARPLGGIVSDILYSRTKSLWAKKAWIVFVGAVAGVLNLGVGLTDPHEQSKMFGLVAAMAFFLEAGNGANFGLLPHVHPYANGIISGITGAAGNLGGVVFAILFRFHGTNYQKSFWIMGIIVASLNLVLAWVQPIPKGQIGGR
ncbi:hypothetical protein, variant [Verruconis gallopava]|uniref:Nitrate/nitrite transporter n=1 Tax=Verruconis gallopava TaxID=253628 RepID=A0A0D2A7E9_9PEZI|nr:hypothetical protein, variant [Verruconis gallopava]KIW02470.1 hypothetical protein, variant [Verruconis gallopava]